MLSLCAVRRVLRETIRRMTFSTLVRGSLDPLPDACSKGKIFERFEGYTEAVHEEDSRPRYGAAAGCRTSRRREESPSAPVLRSSLCSEALPSPAAPR